MTVKSKLRLFSFNCSCLMHGVSVFFGQMMPMNQYQRQKLPNPKRRRKQRNAVKAGAVNDRNSSERLEEHL